MTHFLDKLPYDFQDPAARDLWTLLADNYYTQPKVVSLVSQTGLKPAQFNWEQAMVWVWAEILTAARAQDKLRPLLTVVATSGDSAIATRIGELVAATPVVAAPAPAAEGQTWTGFDDDGGGVERIILAESTLLDIAFLRRGVELAAAVCRLLVTYPGGSQSYGTGFLIADRHVLTNHHVLFDHDHGNAKAEAVEAWFGFERTFSGQQLTHTVIIGDPGTIQGAEDHDWASIEIASVPAGASAVALTGATPVEANDRVYIIQHPGGSPKKIGMIHNVVRHVDANVVQYLTDTEAGSSGAPVFNEQWQLVALHHRWVEKTVNGAREYRNQGRRIERVAEGLTAVGVI